jgi:hypothetical protein
VKFYADTTGYVTLDGTMGFDAGPLYFNAELIGAVLLPNFYVEGSGSGGIRHVLSGTVKALISNRGLAGCGSVDIGPFTVSGGAGVHFNPRLLLGPLGILSNLSLFLGCDLSDWVTVVAPRDARAAAPGTRVFTVARGQRALIVRVQGLGKAPRALLRGPDGTTIDLSNADEQRTNRGLGVRADAENRSFFLVARPHAGLWKVIPAPGSVPIVALQRATILPRPQVTAHVTGTGAKRRLSWSVAPVAGQVVRFVEQGNHGGQLLATVRRGGRGSVTFVPAPARGARRTIVADVEENGVPRTVIAVARFSAPSPRVGRPGGVHLRRAGRAAVLSWGPAFYASRYEVIATFTTGSRVLLSPRPGARKLVIRGLSRRAGVTVQVIGIAKGGMRGPPGTARLAVPRSRHQPKRRRKH